MKEGEIQYDGDPQHLVERVDYREVKLPAPMIMELAIQDPPPQPFESPAGV